MLYSESTLNSTIILKSYKIPYIAVSHILAIELVQMMSTVAKLSFWRRLGAKERTHNIAWGAFALQWKFYIFQFCSFFAIVYITIYFLVDSFYNLLRLGVMGCLIYFFILFFFLSHQYVLLVSLSLIGSGFLKGMILSSTMSFVYFWWSSKYNIVFSSSILLFL